MNRKASTPRIVARTATAALALMLAAGCTSNGTQSDGARGKADTVFTGGKIYTVNPGQPWAEAIAVKGNEIVYVGDDAGAGAFIGDKTAVNDLGGKFVMPGIISTHEHSIFMMAVKSGLVFKEVSQDKNKMLAELEEYLEENPDGPFIAFGGAYESRVEIHRKELDAITGPDRPFFIMAATGHGGWANTKALELAGVTADEEPIDFFGKDDDGTRNGYVGTAAACGYMMSVAGLKKDAVLKHSAGVLKMIASVGVTHMWECGQPPGSEEPLFDAIGQLEKEGKLTSRYTVAVMVQRQHQIPGAIEALKRFSKTYHSRLFNVSSLKIHGDGALEGHTSKLVEPYADKPEEPGILSVPEGKSIEAALEVTRLGFDMHTHAIGDGAVRSFLNVFQNVREAGLEDVRLTMGHTTLVDDADLQRFKDLDVTANYFTLEQAQPNTEYLERLGPERYKRLMRLGTMLDMGIRVALSADYPSMPLNPFPHIQAGVTRCLPGEKEILGPEEEKLSVAQAIKAYTLDAAYPIRAETYSGSLEVGKRADFIVLDRNLFEIPEDDIGNTLVLQTFLDGKKVFDRDKEVGETDVVKIKVTNPHLQSAVDKERLNLLVLEESQGIPICGDLHETEVSPGSKFAPEEVSKAFGAIPGNRVDRFARPARMIHWEPDDADYWIQWTIKGETATLWAFDPEAGKAVEVLQVREK